MSTDSTVPAQRHGSAWPAADHAEGQFVSRNRHSVPVGLNEAATSSSTANLTVVVPTRNEEHNVEVLLARLGPAVAPLGAEIIVVDDSDDQTPAELARHAGSAPCRYGCCTGQAELP